MNTEQKIIFNQWIAVESSAITHVKYDLSNRSINIRFNHGKEYSYENPIEMFMALLFAESIGKFYNRFIKKRNLVTIYADMEVEVKSSYLKSFHYNSMNRKLTIFFKNEEIIQYFKVPSYLAMNLYMAESKGKFFLSNIRDNHVTKTMSFGQPTFVTSSFIEWVRYHTYDEMLDVAMKNGNIYRYFDVPEHIYTGFLEAKSMGKFFSKFIRTEHRLIKAFIH